MDNSGDHVKENISITNEKIVEDDTLPNQGTLEYLSTVQKLRENRILWSHFSGDSETTNVSRDASESDEDVMNKSKAASHCVQNTSYTPDKLSLEYGKQQNNNAPSFILNTSKCNINVDSVGVSYCPTKTMGIQCSLNILNSKNCMTQGTVYDLPDLSSKGVQCSLEDYNKSIVGQTQCGTTRCPECLEKCHLSAQNGVCSVVLCKSVEVQSKEENNSEKEMVSVCKSNDLTQEELTCSHAILSENKGNECVDDPCSLGKNERDYCEDTFINIPAESCSSGSQSTLCKENNVTTKTCLEDKYPLSTSFMVDNESQSVENDQQPNVYSLPDLSSFDDNFIPTTNEKCLESETHKVQTTGIQCSTNISDSVSYQTCGTDYDPPNRVSLGTQCSDQCSINDNLITNNQLRRILKCSECLKFCNTLSGHGVCSVIHSQATESLSKRKETSDTSCTTQTEQNVKEKNISVQSCTSSSSVENINSSNFNEAEALCSKKRTRGVQCSSISLGSTNNQANGSECDPLHSMSQGIQCSLDTYNVNIVEQTLSGKICCLDCRKKCNMSSSHRICNVISPKPSIGSSKRLCVRSISITNPQLGGVQKCSDCLNNCHMLPGRDMCSIVSSQLRENSIPCTKRNPPNIMPGGIQCSLNDHVRENLEGRIFERIPVCSDCIDRCNVRHRYYCVNATDNITSLSKHNSSHGTKTGSRFLESQGVQCSIDNNFQDNSAGKITEGIPYCSDCMKRCNRSARRGLCSVIDSQSTRLTSSRKKASENKLHSMNNSMTKSVKELPTCSMRPTSNEVLSSMKNSKNLRRLQRKKSVISCSSTPVLAAPNVLRSEIIELREVAMDNSLNMVNLDMGSSPCTTQCIEQLTVQRQAKNNHFQPCISNDCEDEDITSIPNTPNINTVLVNGQSNKVTTTGVQCALKTLHSENSQSYGTQYELPNVLSQGTQCSLGDVHHDIPLLTDSERMLVCSNCIRRCNISAGSGICNVISSQSANPSSKEGSIPRRNELCERGSDIFSRGSPSRLAEQSGSRSEISHYSGDGVNTSPNLPSVSSKVQLSEKNNYESKMVSKPNPIVVLRDIFKNVSKDPLVSKYLSDYVNIQEIRSEQERKDQLSSDTNAEDGMSISRSKLVQNEKCDIVSLKSPMKKRRLWNPSNEIVSVSDGNLSEQDAPGAKFMKQTRGRKKFGKLNFYN